MCGIVGIWNHDGEPADVEVLRGMMTTIGHRGPDDDGEWTSGSMGLGHVRLSIIDLSRRGRQPFVTSDGDGILAYNGEVYNFRALRQKLESEGIEFRSTTDSEVVLYALHVWGPERAVPLFNGMFGFVYVDLRTRSMWVGRDRLGIKPLYVARVGNTSVVASEMKALLAHPLITGRPDMHALTTKVLCVRLEGAWTPFEDMRAVEPGTIERLSNGTAERTVYFDVIRDVDVDLILE